ncbi:hypothetical protein [Streptomyces sp. NBC_00353]|uniref:hypothetical protein n=1 Tax=Streptomyces sp. NBC_00353 TaxID=2975722 RepID=UPI002E26DD82
MTTRTSVTVQLRLHAFPYIGSRPLDSFQPSHIRNWLSELERALPMSSYRRVIFASVSAVLAAAADDALLTKNPCKARTVQAPKPTSPRVRPNAHSRCGPRSPIDTARCRTLEAAVASGKAKFSAFPKMRSTTRRDGCTSRTKSK